MEREKLYVELDVEEVAECVSIVYTLTLYRPRAYVSPYGPTTGSHPRVLPQRTGSWVLPQALNLTFLACRVSSL